MIRGSTADKSMFKLFTKRRSSVELTISLKIERKVDPASMLYNLLRAYCEWFTITVARFLWLMAKVSTNRGPANMDGRNNEKIYTFLWLSCVWFHSRKNLLFFSSFDNSNDRICQERLRSRNVATMVTCRHMHLVAQWRNVGWIDCCFKRYLSQYAFIIMTFINPRRM